MYYNDWLSLFLSGIFLSLDWSVVSLKLVLNCAFSFEKLEWWHVIHRVSPIAPLVMSVLITQ
jgi:hypothetical protein